MRPTYSIRDWSVNFENSRSRQLRELRYVMIPNKHDGDGYTELLDHPNGAAHFGAWCAIVEVASKCAPRGALVRQDGTPHDANSLSRLTRIPARVFNEVFPRLITIGWAESDEQTLKNVRDVTFGPEGDGPISTVEDCRVEEKEKQMVRDAKLRSPSRSAKSCDEEFLTELQTDEAYTNLNVRQVYAKMVRWCKQHGKVATRNRLVGWLNKEDAPLVVAGNGAKAAPARYVPNDSEEVCPRCNNTGTETTAKGSKICNHQ